MHWIISLLYSICGLLYVSTAVCHLLGASLDPCELLEKQNNYVVYHIT
jgi:hypothetical protein